MKTNIPPQLQERLTNMNKEAINEILTTETSAADIADQLKWIEKQLTKPNQVTVEGWVARDMDGIIYLYYGKPDRMVSSWSPSIGIPQRLPIGLFPSVTFENSPKKVRITITPIEE